MKETSLPARHHRHPGPYTLPSGMSVPDGEDTPLYLLVARWAVIQNRPLTSRDISEAFHIINRRASDIMLYISRLPDSVLTSHLLWLHPDGESRRRAIRVTAVYGRPAPVEPKNTGSGIPPATRKSKPVTDLRNWMVSRRPGETTPASLLASGTGEKH